MTKICCLLLLLACLGCRNDQGEKMPPIDMVLTDSVTHFNTNQIPKGKPVVLINFSPTCGHSQNETDSILKDMNAYKGVVFCFIADRDPVLMRGYDWVFKLYTYPNIIVGHDYKHEFPAYFKNKGWPYLVVYDKDQRIRGIFVGERPREQLRSFIEKL